MLLSVEVKHRGVYRARSTTFVLHSNECLSHKQLIDREIFWLWASK